MDGWRNEMRSITVVTITATATVAAVAVRGLFLFELQCHCCFWARPNAAAVLSVARGPNEAAAAADPDAHGCAPGCSNVSNQTAFREHPDGRP